MGERDAVIVSPVGADAPDVLALIDALTTELAAAEYTAEQTFGYTADQLARSGVHLVGAWVDSELVGIGGVEIDDAAAELKRFYVVPARRGRGVADAIISTLIEYAQRAGATVLRLETGDKQHAARAFYGRHGFVEIPRFGPYVDSETSVCMQRPL